MSVEHEHFKENIIRNHHILPTNSKNNWLQSVQVNVSVKETVDVWKTENHDVKWIGLLSQ
jgi:hypothetical protein